MKQGTEFLHKHYLDPDESNRGNKVPLHCVVTAVRHGVVYWKAKGDRKAHHYFPIEHASKHTHSIIKEDVPPQSLPATNPNNTGGIKAGPIQIGKSLKNKNGPKVTQGSQRAPMDTQIIMAGDWRGVKGKTANTAGMSTGKLTKTAANPMDKTSSGFTSANETLSPSANAGTWIHDFVKSKNSKFDGDSKKQRIKRALGAYFAHHKESVNEGAAEHESFKDHTKNPYHETLTKHGFVHQKTEHKQNPLARNNPRADDTEHLYTHPAHGKSHVIVTQEHDPTVGHGGRKSKGHHFLHRHEQSNGLMAPEQGDSKQQLHRSLSWHYGVPKGMEAPKLTAHEKRYPHTSPHYKMNESLTDDSDPKTGDFVHAGFGTKGGAGVHGTVMKVDGNHVHIKGSHMEYGLTGPFHKTYKAHKRVVTVLHREDYVISMDDVQPIIEAAKRKLSTNVLATQEIPKDQQPTNIASVKENYADWHDAVSKHGEDVQFKVKNAGGRTEAWKGGKKIGHYNHETRQAHVSEARKLTPGMSDEERFHKLGSIDHKGYIIHKHHIPNEGNTARISKGAHHISWAKDVHHAKQIIDDHLTEDVILEAGRALKNKVREKIRSGTTATGKKAHEVVVDPFIKIDDRAASLNALKRMPAPDRGL